MSTKLRSKRVSSARTVVFLGPTLDSDLAQSILPATYYSPAAQGDVYRLLSSGVHTIVLIDGTFHGTRAVWQRELLDAIREGIRVIGAASMGALRAAELHSLGMIGCGTVFRWYRDGVIDGDDEVGQLHGPQQMRFLPLSEPLVNIRFTLMRAVRQRILSHREASLLVRFAKRLYFPNRSYTALLNSRLVKSWNKARLHRFARFLETQKVDIKRNDAILALQFCKKKRKQSRKAPIHIDSGIWELDRCLDSGFFVGSAVIKGEAI